MISGVAEELLSCFETAGLEEAPDLWRMPRCSMSCLPTLIIWRDVSTFSLLAILRIESIFAPTLLALRLWLGFLSAATFYGTALCLLAMISRWGDLAVLRLPGSCLS